MALTVTNSGNAIIIDTSAGAGGNKIRISKQLCIVSNIGNNVRIDYGTAKYIEFPYTEFSSPAGASASAVADAIEVFLDTISTNELIQQIDVASPIITYVGHAALGSLTSNATWRIKRISISGNITSILYADGNTLFDNIFDNRATLSYS